MFTSFARYCRDHLSLFLAGAIGYCGIEVLVRGHTHWTMLLAGGLCLVGLEALDRHLARTPLLLRCLAGAALITGVELVFGLVCNRLLHWAVWDYSAQWGNLWGQVCPRFSIYWFLLCLPVFRVLELARRPWQK